MEELSGTAVGNNEAVGLRIQVMNIWISVFKPERIERLMVEMI